MVGETRHYLLEILTPVHIGCGEVYEPTSFVVDKEQQELVLIDHRDFLDSLDQEQLRKFSDICQKGTIESLLELYRFMQKNAACVDGDRVKLTNGFLNHYEKTLHLTGQRIKKELNQFIIARTAFNSLDQTPFIPGSAIKGALRTAVLNYRNSGKSTPEYRGKDNGKKMEQDILENMDQEFETDPFRLVKVSDFIPVDNLRRNILYAVNRKKEHSEYQAAGPYQILEVIEPGAFFVGTVTVFSPDKAMRIRRPVSHAELIEAVNSFYKKEFEREKRELTAMGVKPVSLSSVAEGHVIRIGRHSGAECVTVEGHRSIKIMQGRNRPPKYEQGSTTLWLAAPSAKPETNNQLRPFGWTSIREITAEKASSLYKKHSYLQEEILEKTREKIKKRLEYLHELKVRQAEAIALKKKREAEEKQRREEEKKKPWLQFIREVERISDWGTFKIRVLQNEDARKWRQEEGVGKAVHEAALRIYEKFPKKWTDERDKLVAEWLEPCSISWENKASTSSKDDQPHGEFSGVIMNCSNWGQYKNAQIDISELSLSDAIILQKKLKKWKCNHKRAGAEKQKAWKELQAHIKALKSNK